MLTLNNIRSPKGAVKNRKRLGRGQGSGQGTQAGKGDKGQNARSGGGPAVGFEGGQSPIYRRLPKRGFSNAPFKKSFACVSVEDVAKKFTTELITRELMVEKGILSGKKKSLPIKILNSENFKSSLNFSNEFLFSETAKASILSNGGKIKE